MEDPLPGYCQAEIILSNEQLHWAIGGNCELGGLHKVGLNGFLEKNVYKWAASIDVEGKSFSHISEH